MCGDSRKKVEEIEDNLGSSVRIDTEGDERGECVARQLRVWTQSDQLRHHGYPQSKRNGTLFANLEELVGFPGDHSSRESAPAPFHNAT